ncbi:histidine phosphatase family protein [Microbulbifer agarilyticus]|uniref:histidine phosphatase family protein n=1 Tax=Microbulbifer agarilyticus TaxID=260552 RepID=UPI001C98C615|nr:histidine phosphatase family protein [Microbulbifer agarilyticus]MBY6211964.1 histidine phosphatase family protein [Microbulbifer agarilyticus]MCA0893958.1 histidine phosphatase family protein [Microbulbifer agarilyticus]
MHEIVLIRHGEAAKSPTDDDPGLTALGHKQAEQLAGHLNVLYPGGQGVRLMSSPKSRARQTAEPIASLWQKPLEQLNDVIEIPSPEGVSLAQRGDWIQAFLNSNWNDLTVAQHAWRNGIIRALKSIESRPTQTSGPVETTLVFCHFMVINAVIAEIRQDARIAQFRPDYTSQTRLSLDNDVLTIVELGLERHAPHRIQ